MPEEMRACWVCAICKHVWIKTKKEAPLQCSNPKCRSRLWNAARRRAMDKRLELRAERAKTITSTRTPNFSAAHTTLRKRLTEPQGKSHDAICATGA